jgi:hypothetical protein
MIETNPLYRIPEHYGISARLINIITTETRSVRLARSYLR